jgi:hypothetical protein
MRFKGLLVSMGFNPGRNDKYYRKINIDTIEFRFRINLLIMISIIKEPKSRNDSTID